MSKRAMPFERDSSRTRMRRVLRRAGHISLQIFKALLLAGGALGPGVPPPPPPPPQTIMMSDKQEAAEDED